MSSSPHVATAAVVTFDRASNVPLYQQLAESLREAIVTGRLASGTRLPSTRALAETLAIARNTVSLAYEDLVLQGYLESRVGSGTFVSGALPENLLRTRSPADLGGEPAGPAPVLSRRGRRVASLPVSQVRQQHPPRLFRAGVPGIDRFAAEVWLRLSTAVWRERTPELLGYGDPQGDPDLRAAIAQFLGASRAVRCTPDQVVVVSGSQQALDLAATVLMDEGDEVWIEDPARTAARSVFRAAGQRLVPIPLDDEGLIVELGRRRAPNAPVAYVSPSSQFPMSVHMSIRRRLELLEWAAEAGAWVIEDDYDSEYRYAGRPLPALQGLDGTGRVIYSGTFSHALFPSLRLGYLIVPQGLAEPFAKARALIDRQSPTWEQATLARFIAGGHFDRHLRRMRRHYALRQEALIESVQRYAPQLLSIKPARAGMHVLGFLPDGVSDRHAEEVAYRHGVECTALSRFAIEAQLPAALVLGYAVASERQIRYAVRKLAAALEEAVATQPAQPVEPAPATAG